MRERDFQRAVIELARRCGFRVHHQRAGIDRSGRWTSAITGDRGLPDLILCREGELIVAELKSDKGRVTADQQVWLQVLGSAGVEVYVWRPLDWEPIEARLTRPIDRRRESRTERRTG